MSRRLRCASAETKGESIGVFTDVSRYGAPRSTSRAGSSRYRTEMSIALPDMCVPNFGTLATSAEQRRNMNSGVGRWPPSSHITDFRIASKTCGVRPRYFCISGVR